VEDRWLESVIGAVDPPRPRAGLIGVIPGEGVGPDVTEAALEVAHSVAAAGGQALEVETAGSIGLAAERDRGHVLPEDVAVFCESIFERGGAVLNGPGGGRYVYDLRRRLDLFLKISPIQARTALPDASPLKPHMLEGVDLLIVRENVGGVYQGEAAEVVDPRVGRVASHAFSYAEADVRRFLTSAARLAASRRGELTVVTKEAGVPAVSSLWRDCALEAAEAHGVGCSLIDVDLMAYRLVATPRDFDVVAAPNLCGDVLSDLAAVLLGSRGVSFSGNFTPRGHAVYQTNHGAAHDIAGSDRANPLGQLFSMAMLLRVSLGLEREAAAIEGGIREIWRQGYRSAEVATNGDRVVGTRALAALVADAAADHFRRAGPA
jgi:3-isopropylmalate dehydrogenase